MTTTGSEYENYQAPMPSLFLSHGAPPLVDDRQWVQELQLVAAEIPRPASILILSAHWEAAPLTIGSTNANAELTYDFWGFPERFYQTRYDAPGAKDLAKSVAALMPSTEPIAYDEHRRLDHGAYVPLTVMYPNAEIPVLQVSLPSQNPSRLIELGKRLAPLRDEGVLIIGSGFTTHGLPFLTHPSPASTPPAWSVEFDHWTKETTEKADIDSLIDFQQKAPGMPYAHPTTEHFAPLFVSIGASSNISNSPTQLIDGFWMGLAKRSLLFS